MNLKNNPTFKKYVNYETVSYLICGVLTTIVGMGTNALFYYSFGMGVLTANTLSWVIAVIFAYVINKLFVFQSKSWAMETLLKEIPSFTAARLLSLLFEDGFMWLTVEKLGGENWVMKILASVFVIIMNYFASKFIIFKKKEENDV